MLAIGFLKQSIFNLFFSGSHPFRPSCPHTLVCFNSALPFTVWEQCLAQLDAFLIWSVGSTVIQVKKELQM